MSNIVDKIEIDQDLEGMLRRALERIIQLYTDKSHFVYELLQNAEDAGATGIKFIQYADRLEVLHDGRPFTEQNLKSLCDIGMSDKADNLNQIGEFGVGFKSVFGICETVQLYSAPDHYRRGSINDAVPFAVYIQDFVRPKSIEYQELPSSYTTRFVFPYTVGKSFSGFSTVEELKEILSAKLQNLGITTLLFMKSLESIEYEIKLDDNVIEGQYLLEKQTINDHCSRVSALGISNVNGNDEGDNFISYLKFSRPIDDFSIRTVDIAFPIRVLENGDYECVKPKDPYISVYFPTETESKLDFIVQGPYRTTPNRSSIPAADKDNIRFAKETAILLREALIELRDSNKLNMSFIKALPLNARVFDNYNLFAPLYDTVKALLLSEKIIPTNLGDYTYARAAKIPRPERLVTLFSDALLEELHADGTKYKWLPAFLTETNAEYEHVYRYCVNELKITVIRPENLRLYFDKNPNFLPKRDNDWLVELYSVFENVAAAFSKNKNEINTLTCSIVKTSKGIIVAPYRKTENKQLIPNVFLYSDSIDDPDIHFVDPEIYSRCTNFFDNILTLQKPNEYEFFVKDIRRRYEEGYVFDEEKHIDDFKKLIKFYKHEEYRDEIQKIISECFLIKCSDDCLRSPYMTRIYLSVNDEGIEIENYFRNVVSGTFYVDSEYYSSHGIGFDLLAIVGVRTTILINETINKGLYDTGRPGRQPSWWTYGGFCWKLSIESIKDVLRYISKNPTAKDSPSKSYTIFKLLMQNEVKLVGTLHIDKPTIPNKENESCDLIRILRGEMLFDWDGKWIYTSGGELVSPKMVSRHEIASKYKIKDESIVYELLGFKKTALDDIDDLKKSIPTDKLDALLEHELRVRFGIGIEDIRDRLGETNDDDDDGDDPYGEVYEFPTARVKNWDALRKHAAEMLCYADPVKYDYAVRKVRVSNKPKEIRAYLYNMYRYSGIYKYACQMCHDSCASVEIAEIFNKPETELDPMNLCLCPNCATKYRAYRNNESLMKELLAFILNAKVKDSELDYVEVPVEEDVLWFTQVHFAEIQELIKLAGEAENASKKNDSEISPDDSEVESGTSVYKSLIGKKVKRKDGFAAEVIDLEEKKDGTDLVCKILNGPKINQETKIQLSFILSNPNVYQIM